MGIAVSVRIPLTTEGILHILPRQCLAQPQAIHGRYPIMLRFFLLFLLSCILAHPPAFAVMLTREAVIGIHPVSGFPAFIAEPGMRSPKSAAFSPDGRLLVINALEAGKTFAYAVGTWKKVWEVRHKFPAAAQTRQAGMIPVRLKKFFAFPAKPRGWSGKPVEMAFTPDGRLLYVTSYRKDFDPHGHLASSVSVIETSSGKIVASLPSGPIPKSLAIAPDGSRLVVADWGDNTISVWALDKDGLPRKLLQHFAAGKRLDVAKLDGDRDKQCGWCLRGVVFAPDGSIALVSRMSRVNGLDVVDAVSGKHLGLKRGVPSSLRHLVWSGDKLFASSCAGRFVASIEGPDVVAADSDTAMRAAWKIHKTGSSVRTIAVSGALVLATLHQSQKIGLYDASTLKCLASIPAPAWPVGACLSPDESWAVVTSQGYKGSGGNTVSIFKIQIDQPEGKLATLP